MNQAQLKKIWIIWLVLALLTTATLTFMDVANHAPQLETRLQDGTQFKWEVWRPFATSDSKFEMSYQRGSDGDLRFNLLGDKDKGVTGAPVLVNLSVNGKTCRYQQHEVSSWHSRVFRILEPVQPGCVLPEQSGWNEWTAVIMQVSPQLVDEKVYLHTIAPSGTWKARQNNVYGSMAEILFWGELIWLPFFLFMSIPLWIDGINRLAKRFDWEVKLQRQWQKIKRNRQRKR